jgi:hypothetical protein
MEALVLQVLGWKLLGVTTLDFVDNMLAHLPLSGVPSALVQTARRRADDSGFNRLIVLFFCLRQTTT